MEMLNLLKVSSLYAGIIGVIYFALSLNVIRNRWKFKTGIGTGGHRSLDQAIRVHGNFSEYAPLILILMTLVEIKGSSSTVLHVIGLSLLIGRTLHALGLSKSIGTSKPRFFGMILTFNALLMSSFILIGKSLF